MLRSSCETEVEPTLDLKEPATKQNFYRFVWEPRLFSPGMQAEHSDLVNRASINPFSSSMSFSSQDLDHPDEVLSSAQQKLPRGLFINLPGEPLLTLSLDAPHGWMVTPVQAVHDLDNLRLSEVKPELSNGNMMARVDAVFELEYLLLEGHCAEEGSMKPPRGLQFTLGTRAQPNQYDTIVMANLGYFQLKARPGAWYLNIRSGRSRDLYKITRSALLFSCNFTLSFFA
ncbi:unnamed protein product [Protopolystoma xenopodis]|uniref:Uncharacterized protein n=1 Tax=Protopolystoma xenopodis TaxID=117903 RepID=A0A448XGR0_9PLAT|nr:unnamed protein product [Protopolystoma xenopodis]